jgi:hypothetical protein
MILDAKFAFGLPTIANSNTATVSPYVYDAGSAIHLFRAGKGPYLWFRATVTADADPTIKVDMIASDQNDLDPDNSEATNDVLGSTGVITQNPEDGTVLVSGETVEMYFEIRGQRTARRYYGLLVTLGGTNPDLAASQDAYIVYDVQNNLIGARAAVPA